MNMNEITDETKTNERLSSPISVSFFDFEINNSVLNQLRASLPPITSVASIGCGYLPNEPAQLANLLDREINYFGYDIDERNIQSSQSWASRENYQKGTNHQITTEFLQDDLSLQKNRNAVELVFFNQPDVLGSQEDDWLEHLEEASEKWVEIFKNSLSMLSESGKVISICHTKDEEELIRNYLSGQVKITHTQANAEGMRMIMIIGFKQ